MEDKDRSSMTSSDGWTFLPSENNSRRNSTEATDVTPSEATDVTPTGQTLNQYDDDQSSCSIEEIPIPEEDGVTDRQTDDEEDSLSTTKPDMMRMSSNSSGSSVSSTFRFLNRGSESPLTETLGPKVDLDLRADDLHEDDDIYVQDVTSDPDDFVKVAGGGVPSSVPEVGSEGHPSVTEEFDTQDLSNMSWMNHYDDLPRDQKCIRCYRHMPNNQLNATLTNMTLIAVIFVVGIGVGHYIGEGLDMTPEAEMYRRQAEQCQALYNLQTANQPHHSVNPPHDSANPPHDPVNEPDDPVNRPIDPIPNHMKVLHYDHMTPQDMMSELLTLLKKVHSPNDPSTIHKICEDISTLVAEFAWKGRNGHEPDHPEHRVNLAVEDLLEVVHELRRNYNYEKQINHHNEALAEALNDQRVLVDRLSGTARVWKVMYMVTTETDQWMLAINELRSDIIVCHDNPTVNMDCAAKISELKEKTFDWLKLYENFTVETDDSSLFDTFLVENVKAYFKGTDYVEGIVNKTKETLSAFRASVHKALPSQVHHIVNNTKKTISSIKQSVKRALPSWEGVKEGASTVKKNVVNTILPTIQEQAGDIKASVKSGWQSVKNKLFTEETPENDAGDIRGTYDGEGQRDAESDNDGILPAFKDKVTRGWRSVASKLFKETDSVLDGDVEVDEKVDDTHEEDYDEEDVYIEDGDLDDDDSGYFTNIYDHDSHYNHDDAGEGSYYGDYLDDDLEDDDGVESVEENISRTAHALSGQHIPEHDDNGLVEDEEDDGDIKDGNNNAHGGDNRENSNTLGGDNSAHRRPNNEGRTQEVRGRSMDRSGNNRHRSDEIHDVYNELEEFENEVEKNGNGHMGKLRKWFSCQKQWWKARITNSHHGNTDLLQGCKKQLTKWQKADCKSTDGGARKNPEHKKNKKEGKKRKNNKKPVENHKKWRRDIDDDDNEYKHEDKMRKLDKKRQHNKDQKRNENGRKPIQRQKNVNRRQKKKYEDEERSEEREWRDRHDNPQGRRKSRREFPESANERADQFSQKLIFADEGNAVPDEKDAEWWFKREQYREEQHNPDWFWSNSEDRDPHDDHNPPDNANYPHRMDKNSAAYQEALRAAYEFYDECPTCEGP